MFRLFFVSKSISNGSRALDFEDSRVLDYLKVISNKSINFDDPKEFEDPQVFDDPNGISIRSMDLDSPKVYGDTSIFDCLVSTHKIELALDNDNDVAYDYFNSHDRVGP